MSIDKQACRYALAYTFAVIIASCGFALMCVGATIYSDCVKSGINGQTFSEYEAKPCDSFLVNQTWYLAGLNEISFLTQTNQLIAMNLPRNDGHFNCLMSKSTGKYQLILTDPGCLSTDIFTCRKQNMILYKCVDYEYRMSLMFLVTFIVPVVLGIGLTIYLYRQV